LAPLHPRAEGATLTSRLNAILVEGIKVLEMVSKRVIIGQIWGQGYNDVDILDILERDAVNAIDAVLADSPTGKFLFGNKQVSLRH